MLLGPKTGPKPPLKVHCALLMHRQRLMVLLALCHVHACAVLQGGPVASPGLFPVTPETCDAASRCSPPPGACGVAWRATRGDSRP